jgi:predicted DNA-binding protein
MSPRTKTFTFGLPDELKTGLRVVRERDGLTEAEQIRRAIIAWLRDRGVMKAERKRAVTRKRP